LWQLSAAQNEETYVYATFLTKKQTNEKVNQVH